MNLREMRLECIDWVRPSQSTVVGSCECSNEPSGSIKDREFLD